MTIRSTLRIVSVLVCTAAVATAGAPAISDQVRDQTPVASGQPVEIVTQADLRTARTERGLARFFGPDDALFSLGCGTRARGIPMSIRAMKPDEPDPEPFRGMMLEPMFDGTGRPLVTACFDPNDPPSAEVIEMLETAMAGLDRFFLGNRWSGTQGTPRNLRWSFVPDGLSIPSGIGEPTAPSTLFATMDSKFGNNRALWIGLFEQSFERWSQLAGLTYTRITSGGNDWDDGASWGSNGSSSRGDVRIAMKPIDGSSGVLAYNAFPSSGDMVLDAAENWQSSSNNYRFARNIIMHEHGHGMGIAHSCPANGSKLMEPSLSTSFDGPRQDDVRAAQRHYGDVFGNNNSFATATDLGALANGQTLNPSAWPAGQTSVPLASRTSIDSNSEQDFYRFSIDAPRIVNITLVPVGSNYATYAQNSNGSCPGTTTANENALAIRDLAFDVLNASGQVQLNVDANGIGLGESRTGLLLSPAGNWAVRVRSTTNDNTNVQLYTLTVAGVSTPTMSATDGSFIDRVRVQWSTITGATEYRILRGTSTNKALAMQIAAPTPPTVQFDDFTAVGGTTYQYWVDVVQDSIVKPLGGPDSGFYAAPPDPTGACCVGTVCAILTLAECTSQLGVYQGDASVCSANTCAPTGACCVGTDCQVTTAADCLIALGVYLGDDVACTPQICLPTGACCVGPSCLIVTESACASQGGVYKGDDEPCTPEQCVPTGACCTGLVCQVTTEAMCDSMSGNYLGDDAECQPQTCFPTGACCISTLCLIGTEADCLTAGGTYLGNDSTCDGDPCAPPPPCPGDFNTDSVVDLADLLDFLGVWNPNLGQTVESGTNGDTNADGVVDLADLLDFLGQWNPNLGQSCP